MKHLSFKNTLRVFGISVVAFALFLLNSNNGLAQNSSKRIAHLSNGTVVMDIPLDTIKSFLLQTIRSLDSNSSPIELNEVDVLISISPVGCVAALLKVCISHSDGSCEIYGLELEEDNGDIFPIAPNQGIKIHNCKTKLFCKGCKLKREFTNAGWNTYCECTSGFGWCGHSVTTTEGLVVMGILRNEYLDFNYPAFYNMINNDDDEESDGCDYTGYKATVSPNPTSGTATVKLDEDYINFCNVQSVVYRLYNSEEELLATFTPSEVDATVTIPATLINANGRYFIKCDVVKENSALNEEFTLQFMVVK